MDLIIILVLIGVVIFFFRRFSNFVYFIAIIDMFFRLLDIINEKLIRGLSAQIYLFFNNIPDSIPNLLSKYSSGLLYELLFWLYIVIFIIFLGYIIRTFFRKK